MTAAPKDPARNRDIKAIQTGRRALALEDDSYRALLERLTGKRSAADLDASQRAIVIEEFRRLGFDRVRSKAKPKRMGTRAPADSPIARKARALWLSLWQLGAVRDPAENALASFVKRVAKIDALDWLDGRQARAVIEALNDWCEREGYMVREIAEGATRLDYDKALLIAIWLKLKRLDDPSYQLDKWHLDNWIDNATWSRCHFDTLDAGHAANCVARAGTWLRQEIAGRARAQGRA
ncbi:MAG: regulatory protein GemA [Tagaea sp.]|nr:regulatory protein GemA [Tagaea sp.]